MPSREGSRIDAQGDADRDARDRSPGRGNGFALVTARQGPGSKDYPSHLEALHEQRSGHRVQAVRLHRREDRPSARGPLPAPGRAGSRQLVLRRAGHHSRRAEGRYRPGGLATRNAAAAARQAILDGPADETAAGAWTVARWLRYWLAQAEPHLRPSTAHGYRDHIDRYLIPSIGRITLADLTGKRLQACFNLLSRQRTKNGTPIAASAVDRVRATLRSALNAAVREGLIAANPLAYVRLDKPVRPHPVIWTDERVEAWRRDGMRPPVAVWTLRQLVSFLTGVENDRLAALWWLIALRGLRRGEAAAQDRDDLDSGSRELTITRQLIALPGELYCGPP